MNLNLYLPCEHVACVRVGREIIVKGSIRRHVFINHKKGGNDVCYINLNEQLIYLCFHLIWFSMSQLEEILSANRNDMTRKHVLIIFIMVFSLTNEGN